MKRFKFNIATMIIDDLTEFQRHARVTPSPMHENTEGEWVRYDDAIAAVKEAEDKNPEVRIARLEKALGLVSDGRCPECGQKTADYKFPFGGFAPEVAASMKERGLDPFSNHKITCSRAQK